MTFVAVLSKRRLRPQVAWRARHALCVVFGCNSSLESHSTVASSVCFVCNVAATEVPLPDSVFAAVRPEGVAGDSQCCVVPQMHRTS